jgi:hypothetical protein
MTENDAKATMVRANEANQVLNNPLVVNAIDTMRADLYAKLTDTTWRQRAAREAIYHQLKAIDNFEAQFRHHLTNGKLAQSWLEQYRATQELKRSRRRA